MAAKKPAVQPERVKKAKPQVSVRIPKFVSSSPDRIWRRMMITAIREAAHFTKYNQIGKEDKANHTAAQVEAANVDK